MSLPSRTGSGTAAAGLGLAVLAALAGAIAWAVLTVTTDFKIGFAAVGIGLLVGKAVELRGGGDARLPVPAAVIALAGCLLGDLLTDVHFLADAVDLSYAHVLSRALSSPRLAFDLYRQGFKPFDLVFYAIAAYEGFRFATVGVRRAQEAGAATQPWPAPTPAPVQEEPAP